MFFETYRRSKQETSKREDVADQIEKLENQARLFRKAFVDLEKETLKNNGTVLSGTRRILPKEVYELEEEEEEEGKPKGWRSWFQVLYQRNDHGAETKPGLSVESSKSSPQSRSPEQNATTKTDSKSTSILSTILSTTHRDGSANNNQQATVNSNSTTNRNDSTTKEDGSKS